MNAVADKMGNDRPLVSVVMLTFQHERFVAQAIESVLSQQTRFPFELIIGEDGSQDETLFICRKYERRYPDRVAVISTGENVSHNGESHNFLRTCRRCSGEYVAFCEGDDYWTDPLKLQKQVDYMNAHLDCTVCFHPVLEHWEDGGGVDNESPVGWHRFLKKSPALAELLRRNFIQTSSVMYRWNPDGKLFSEFPLKELPGDWLLHILHARHGEIGFIPDVMAVYRRHVGGLWMQNWESAKWFRLCGYRMALFYRRLEDYFGIDRHAEIRRLVLASLAMSPQKKELLGIMCPSVLWVYGSPLISLLYRCMFVVTGRGGMLRRCCTWSHIYRNRRTIIQRLRRKIMDDNELADGFYGIRFNSNDGRDLVNTVAFKYGRQTALPAVRDDLGWDRNGYVFVGWSVTKQGVVAYHDKAWACKGTLPGKIFDVYAIWNPDDPNYKPLVNYSHISPYWAEPIYKVVGMKFVIARVRELCIGSSHAHYDYLADVNCYNLGDPSCDAYYSFEILKYWVPQLPELERVVYFYDIFTPGNIIDRGGEAFRRICWLHFYGMRPQLMECRQDSTIGESYADCEEVFHRCVGMYSASVPNGYCGNAIKRKPMPKVDIAKRVAMHLKFNKGDCDRYVSEMIDYCRNRKLELIIVVPPLRSDYIRELPPGFRVNPPEGARIINYMDSGLFVDEDFIDCDHLTEAGAKKLTRLLHEEIGVVETKKE